MRTALFDTAWGVVAVALAVGSLTLVATLVVLSRPRGAWVRGRLEPYTGARDDHDRRRGRRLGLAP